MERMINPKPPLLNGADTSVCTKRYPSEFGNDLPDEACGHPGVEEFKGILLCERHMKEVEAQDRKDHWEEVHVYLSMWTKVASARGNETLLRLLRYAQVEARADREYQRKALERSASAGR